MSTIRRPRISDQETETAIRLASRKEGVLAKELGLVLGCSPERAHLILSRIPGVTTEPAGSEAGQGSRALVYRVPAGALEAEIARRAQATREAPKPEPVEDARVCAWCRGKCEYCRGSMAGRPKSAKHCCKSCTNDACRTRYEQRQGRRTALAR